MKPTKLKRTRFKTYYRWLLYISLSLYFLHSSFLPSSSKLPTGPSPVKIYIYALPPEYTTDRLADPRCGAHLFASEVAVHEAVAGSGFRVSDPEDADFFFVPAYVSCVFSSVNGFPVLGGARDVLAGAVERVRTRYPFWNRTEGRDHLFVASHDYGACFHAMEEAAIAEGIPEFMKNSILLQTFGVQGPHPCQEAEHVMIPPYVSPDILELAPRPEEVKRDIWVFFRGKMEVHPKNISGKFYSRKVRTEIWNRFSSNRRFYLKRKRFASYRSEIVRSVFCLCPLGWAPWSPRLVESVALGCVPVIIADNIRLPFSDVIDWPSISLTVPERDVSKLERVLDRVSSSNLTAIQRNLWAPGVREALMYHRPMREGDATWQAMRALDGKLDRSWRRRSGKLYVDT